MPGSGRPRLLMASPGYGLREANPYMAVIYECLERRGWRIVEFSPRALLRRTPDVLHVHFPEHRLDPATGWARFLRSSVFLAFMALGRMRGARLVWTVHNQRLRSNYRTPWGLAYLRRFARMVDAWFVLVDEHRREVLEEYPMLGAKPSAVLPHPHLRGEYGPRRDRREAKHRLGLAPDEAVVGFFGQVKPYKNLGHLHRVLREGGGRTPLLVAGRFAPECRELLGRLREDPWTVLLDRHLPSDEVAWVLAAADVVALPHRELTNSGVAFTALSYDRPVLAPAVASMVELRSQVGGDWVRLYDGELEPADVASAMAALPTADAQPNMQAFSPERVAELADRFLSGLLEPRC